MSKTKVARKTHAQLIAEIRSEALQELIGQINDHCQEFKRIHLDKVPDRLLDLENCRTLAIESAEQELRDIPDTTGTRSVLRDRFLAAGQIVLATLAEETSDWLKTAEQPIEAELVPTELVQLLGVPVQHVAARKISMAPVLTSESIDTLDAAAAMSQSDVAEVVAAALAGTAKPAKKPLVLKKKTNLDASTTVLADSLPREAEILADSVLQATEEMDFGEVTLRARAEVTRPGLRQRLFDATQRLRSWAGSGAVDHGIRFKKHFVAIHGSALGKIVVSLTDTGVLLVSVGMWTVSMVVSVAAYSVFAAIVTLLEDLVRAGQATHQGILAALSRYGMPTAA